MFSKFQYVALLTPALLGLSSAGVVVPRGAGDICGQKGYDLGKGNYYYSASSKVNTYAACSAKCAADGTCKSFGVGAACMLFSIPVTGNFNADSGSSDVYYDKGCLSSTSSSSSTSSTSAVKTTSSSSTASSTKTSSSIGTTTSKTSSTAPAKTSSAAKTTATTSPVAKAATSTAKGTTSTAAPSTTSTASSSSSSSATTAPSSTSSTTQAASSTAVAIPDGCTAPPAVELTSLNWFNSTHNLDCPNPNFPSTAQVCWDNSHVCVDATDGVAGGPTVCTCTPFCYTGLPSVAYQPFGYGPPDHITINLNDTALSSCSATMPTGLRDFEIGSGHVNCGNAQDQLDFYGDSNADDGGVGSLNYNGYAYNTAECKGTPRYSGSFPLSCARDAGGNATCGLAATGKPVVLALVGFS